MKIVQKSLKIDVLEGLGGSWEGLGGSWEGLGAILAPRGPKTPKEAPKRESFPPPRESFPPPFGTQNLKKIDQKFNQKNDDIFD